MSTNQRQSGLTHVLLAGIILVVAVFGVVGFRVYQVTSKRDSKNAAQFDSARLPAPIEKEIEPIGSIATVVDKQTVNYDLSSPYGTLKHVEQELKQGNFDNVSYFVTPRLAEKGSKLLHTTAGNVDQIKQLCSQNRYCSLGIKSTTFSQDYQTSSYEYPVAGTKGKTIVYQLKDINSLAAAAYGNKQVLIYMVGYGDKWVIDAITIDYYSI